MDSLTRLDCRRILNDEIKAGDIVFLWVTGPQRGIRAVMRVEKPPCLMPDRESEQVYWAERDTQEKFWVIGTLTHRHVNLPHHKLREIEGLENLSVFIGFQQTTNFPVTPAQGEILMRLIRGSDRAGSPQVTGASNLNLQAGKIKALREIAYAL